MNALIPGRPAILLALAAALSGSPALAGHDDLGFYYVGRDNLPTLASGTYAGLPNPNFGRLTMLVAHEHAPLSSSHFHGIGAYSYSGPVDSPSVQSTSGNNHLPEASAAEPPLAMRPGSGLYAGKLATFAGDSLYSRLDLHATDALGAEPAGSFGYYVLHSAGDRWSQSLAGSQPALELLSLTPGLHVGSASTLDLALNAADLIPLGAGEALSFAPVFWVDGAAPPGSVYQAEFRLRDLSATAPWSESGRFIFDLQAVPEPSSLALIGSGIVAAWSWGFRRRRAPHR